MTNKINDIDVSECEKLGETIEGFTCGLGKRIRFANEIITKHDLCEENPNCYFKQLKRLEQENKELKEAIKRLQEENKELGKIINCKTGTIQSLAKVRDDLKQENDELKEENKNYAKLMLEQQEISQKYWECIEKIKQAIEVLAETCNVYPLKTNLDKLITTINEVLNDN